MNNNAWLWIVVVVIIVIGGVWYFASGSSTMSPGATATSTSSTSGGTTPGGSTSGTGSTGSGTAVSETLGQGSISDLIAMKANLVCAINLSTASLKRSGTVYVAAGVMRGDFFTSTSGSATQIDSMIDNGTTLYVWSNSTMQGISLPASTSASGAAIASHGGIDPTTNLNYDCHPWSADYTYFSAPANVYFSAS